MKKILLLIISFLPVITFVFLPTRALAACEIQLFWSTPSGDYSANQPLPSNPKVGDKYDAVAKFVGCAGSGNGIVTIFYPTGSKSSPATAITSNNQEIRFEITFLQEGQWAIQASVGSVTAASSYLTVDPAPPCDVKLFWKTPSGDFDANQPLPANPKVGDKYTAVAKFLGCDKGSAPALITIYSPSGSKSGPATQITSSNQDLKMEVTFTEPGQWAFQASGLGPVAASAYVTVEAVTGTAPPSNSPASAQSTSQPSGPSGNSTAAVGTAGQIVNLLPFKDLLEFFLYVMRLLLMLIGLLATLMVIIGGVRMVTSQGNQEALIKAKNTVFYALAGLALAFLSFSLIAAVQNLLRIK